MNPNWYPPGFPSPVFPFAPPDRPASSLPRPGLELLADGSDAFMRAVAYGLHLTHAGQRSAQACEPGCEFAAGPPAELLHELFRFQLSCWENLFTWMYAQQKPPIPESTFGDRPAKLVMTAHRSGGPARAHFHVVNPTCQAVALVFQIEGLRGPGRPDGVACHVTPEGNEPIVSAGQIRKVLVEIDVTALEANQVHRGAINLRTPFNKRLEVEVNVLA